MPIVDARLIPLQKFPFADRSVIYIYFIYDFLNTVSVACIKNEKS